MYISLDSWWILLLGGNMFNGVLLNLNATDISQVFTEVWHDSLIYRKPHVI